jgi:predicted RNA methylase
MTLRKNLVCKYSDTYSSNQSPILKRSKQKAEEAIGKTEEKITSKRKKDGIFYTPDYIVRYIVESSLGAYLREAEEKCKDEAGLKGDINDKNYGKRERQAYLSYQKILQSVTVCDPACGSGAFLVYVFDYLLAENQRVSAIINPEQSSLLDTDTYFKSILENNIYGVDLNSESVEITKLSLWLKSAQKGKKLTSLNNNIKCGNSLISDSEIAKNKAFKWEDELPEIFDNGGFDVVIGNPPYGATMSDREKEFLEDAYNTYEYQLNSYSLFYERGMHILKDGGVLGFITPANFTYQHYFSNLRSFLQQYTQMSIVKYTYEVFQDADIGDSVSWIIQKSANPKTQIYVSIISHPNEQDFLKAKREYSEIVDARGTYLLSNATVSLKVPVVPLGEITIITVGIKPYQKGKGVPKQTKEDVSEKNYTSTFKVDETYLSCLVGKNFHRYRLLNKPSMYLSYGEWLAEPRKKAPFFDDEKIILRQTADSLIGYLDIEKRIDLNNVYNVGVKSAEFDIKYILGLLNSRFMNFLYQNISQEKGRTFAEVKKNYLIKLPIAEVNAGEQKTITVLVEKILSLNTDRSSSNERFKKLVSTEHIGEKDTERLDQWWTEDFDNLVKRLKVKLSYLQKEDLLELFEKYRDKLIKLDQAIREVDNNIDQQVYKLYNLTAEEIKIVEKS